jgi:hypothetical protein
MCAYCGVQWHRSKLYRDSIGHLVCPDEGKGIDAKSLDEQNAKAHTHRAPRAREAAAYDDPIAARNAVAVHYKDGSHL